MNKNGSLQDPIDITRHLSELTKRRPASQIKRFYKYFQIPGIGQLAGGLPFHEYFPFDTLSASAAQPRRWQISSTGDPKLSGPHKFDNEPISPIHPEASQITVPKQTAQPDPLQKIDVKTALQYGQATGFAPLASWIQHFVTEYLIPDPLYTGGVGTVLSLGNTDGLSKALEALSNVWNESRDPMHQREGILCEEYTYMGGISTATGRGLNIVTVRVDDQGMIAHGPGGLQELLANWDEGKGRRPHLMYTVTIGQNPTGAVMGVERQRQIYQICVEYDIIIIEDQPYWYLQYRNGGYAAQAQSNVKSTKFPFLDSLVPSYISQDYQGRVVRLDTFSKTIAPGCRLGWITAQPVLIERIVRITEASTAGPSGVVQSLIAELLIGPDARDHGSNKHKGWDISGWVRWLEGLRENYERRMIAMCDILEQGQQVISHVLEPTEGDQAWNVVDKAQAYRFRRPAAGMFVWVEMLYETHPLAKHFDLPDLATALWVFLTHKPHLVLVAPGGIFAPTAEVNKKSAWRFFRMSFVADEDEVIRKSSASFASGVAAFWEVCDREEIRQLIDEAHAENMPRDVSMMPPHFC